MTPLTNPLAALRKEQAHLERLLERVKTAIDALSDGPAKKTKKKAATKKRKTKKRKPMSAASRKAVSDRMKQYWAARRTGRRKK